MAVATTLSGTHLVVDPGQEKSVELLVRNTGDVVDQYTVTVLGRVDRWIKAVPAIVNLMPGTEQTVQLVFDLPRTFEARAGEFPIAIKVASREDPKSTIIDEATVEVTPFSAVTARLDPPKRRGARSSAYRLVVESRGNEPTPLVVTGYHADEGDQLDVKLAFPEFVADPGTETTVKVRTVPRKRFLRGQPQTLPFIVQVGGEKLEDPVVVDGVMIQNPMLPPWLLRVLVAAFGVILALVIWLFFFAPKPTSVATTSAAAKDRGGQQIAEAAPGAAAAPPAAAAPAAAPAAAASPAQAAAAAQPAPAATQAPAPTVAPTTTTPPRPAAPPMSVILNLPSINEDAYPDVTFSARAGQKQEYLVSVPAGQAIVQGPMDPKLVPRPATPPPTTTAPAANAPLQSGTITAIDLAGKSFVSNFYADGTQPTFSSARDLLAPGQGMLVVLDCSTSTTNSCSVTLPFFVRNSP